MVKKLVFIVVALAIIGFIGYNYIYQDHRNIAEEEAEHVVLAEELAAGFEENRSKSEGDYLNKTILVTGKVTGMEDKSIVVDNTVFCQFKKPIPGFAIGSTIKIKGRCIGYDDLLGQVKLDQCSIIQ